jgi:hypothetical protein
MLRLKKKIPISWLLPTLLARIGKEPPFRLLVKLAIKIFPVSLQTKSEWDAVDRPQYLFGLLAAAAQAKREGYSAVSAIEFGVAEGYGLLALQDHAAAVTRSTGIGFRIYGFDSSTGLPDGIGDYRDHPDVWKAGDYKMEVALLREKLLPSTSLILGEVRETVMTQLFTAPIGFIAMDLDLYSSTTEALRILTRGDVELLRRVAIYSDDVKGPYTHRFAGELLAIQEFNLAVQNIKLDHWRGIESGRPFPEADWLKSMYIAHNLAAISKVKLTRPDARMR